MLGTGKEFKMQNSKKTEHLQILIERLVQFGLQHSLLQELDMFVARNSLLDIFALAEPCADEKIDAISKETAPELPTELLEELLNVAAEMNLFDAEAHALRVNFEARIMGTLMPRESEVAAKFTSLLNSEGAKAATLWFYDLCIKSNYIRTAQIAKNIKWDYACKYGELEITINLTKPEKDPKTIALERLQPAAGYPKCMLCIENIGYAGRINFPARQTHRVVPFDICGEKWYMQYSPYVYYNEHCIIFSHKHEPMSVTPKAFEQIFDFVDMFPHYTCGSNADLPIVGGSILSHTHFQGGNYEFPMQRAKAVRTYKHENYPDIVIENINWPISSVRVKSENKMQMLAFAEKVLSAWRIYEDKEANIVPFTEKDGEKTPHNTITPILHRSGGVYVFDLVPRNNRTSEEHPDGIFHPHKEIHHIKKENIGLIEVMGLAILPARLKEQSEQICNVLCGKLSAEAAKKAMPEHADWLCYLQNKYTATMGEKEAQSTVKEEIGAKFETCLEHAGVFKQTESGKNAYDKFMHTLGCSLM